MSPLRPCKAPGLAVGECRKVALGGTWSCSTEYFGSNCIPESLGTSQPDYPCGTEFTGPHCSFSCLTLTFPLEEHWNCLSAGLREMYGDIKASNMPHSQLLPPSNTSFALCITGLAPHMVLSNIPTRWSEKLAMMLSKVCVSDKIGQDLSTQLKRRDMLISS